ncbi:MAG: hypothetical protein H6736_08965 [Alphaproteobacteria bacterium]|nr:hypothetical protein [Alphaproteobacteria bacterium]MCB9691933.1 hypothetical protein [Alphaproteobacteria bacterium]
MTLALLVATAGAGEPELTAWHDGYVDVGWFDAAGDGVAYARDVAHRVLGPGPDGRYLEAPWVFYGDPWANAVNSQGDSADLGLDRTNVDRYDGIASAGRSSFLLNRVHLGVGVDRGERLGARAGVNLQPRTGRLGRAGDMVAVDTAYVVWRPLESSDLKVYAGRMESGFGREYRYRHAPVRVGVTPSIVSRYLMGLQTGVRVRGTHRRWLGYSLALTNGGTITEGFGHLSGDSDRNGVPTTTARLGVLARRPVRFEAGVSGQVGPQDAQPDPTVVGYQVGADARLDAGMLGVEAEAVVSHQPGDGTQHTERLDAHGGYLDVQLRPKPRVVLHARVDWRDAELLAYPNLYVSNVVRLTGGARVDLDRHLCVKVEYLHLAEVGPGTRIADDVATASLVFDFETRHLELQ